ncbi:hypothetical protein ACHAWF_014485 [Thalassiosira exigua]
MVTDESAMAEAVEVKTDDGLDGVADAVEVPLPTIPPPQTEDAAFGGPALAEYLGAAPGMGALASVAEQAGGVPPAKRPAQPHAGPPPAKRGRPPASHAPVPAIPPPAVDPAVWESLMVQVRSQLRAMTSDECFSRALELQMLARSEVGSRSQHLSNAMDLMANQGAAAPVGASHHPGIKREKYARSNPPNQPTARSANKAEREVAKQRPIKTNKSAPVPCMKMTPPLPPRCEVDNAPGIDMPAFCQLVNFPTARYYGNCVMCDESEFSIPKQNKGVCNNCDVAIWVVNPTGMNIKWCKGCKNFRKWIDFGVKGYSSKCERCRQQQATRYANQKHKEICAPGSMPHQVVQQPTSMGVPHPVHTDPGSEMESAAAVAAAVVAAGGGHEEPQTI